MATRGAIYTSAASAIGGHDNCRCIAVPERAGTEYTVPAMVRDADKRFAEAIRQLRAERKAVTLNSAVARMDSLARRTVVVG